MTFGLVLGAGGIQGAAWLAGALSALREAGLDPAAARSIVGTSAGSILAAGVAAGLTPEEVIALEPAESDRSRASRTPVPWPGSPRLAALSVLRPLSLRPGARLAGWLPSGVASTGGLEEMIGRVAPRGWDHHAGLRIVACDFETGQRVCFGSTEAPRSSLPRAVAASCSVPGVFEPVTIGTRRYIDGGPHSLSNLDLLAGSGLALVICLNPTSSPSPTVPAAPAGWVGNGFRAAAAWQVRRESARVRRSGTEVLLLEPTAEDIEQMGVDLMSPLGRGYTALLARRTTADQLRASGTALSDYFAVPASS